MLLCWLVGRGEFQNPGLLDWTGADECCCSGDREEEWGTAGRTGWPTSSWVSAFGGVWHVIAWMSAC